MAATVRHCENYIFPTVEAKSNLPRISELLNISVVEEREINCVATDQLISFLAE